MSGKSSIAVAGGRLRSALKRLLFLTNIEGFPEQNGQSDSVDDRKADPVNYLSQHTRKACLVRIKRLIYLTYRCFDASGLWTFYVLGSRRGKS